MNFGILEAIITVFFTALIVSVLFRKLKLSAVLGYLVAGALLGPHALGLVSDSSYIDELAEFGIVFLMFTVGLEFSIPKLFALRHAVFIVGGFQVLFCILVTTIIALLLKMNLAVSIVVGSIVAMSSTALVVKQLNDQMELQTPFGLNALGILLFQDLAVIPLIILITSLAKTTQYSFGLTLTWALMKGILAIFLIFILGRWLLKPFFQFITKARAIELFTLTCLLVTLTSAWITHVLGLSFALGAFLAGIMLAETEFRHQIEVEIRPFRDILLALFFITIGMLTNIQTWYQTWFWILLLLLALTLGKMLLIIIFSRMIGGYSLTATRTGIVLAQGGEFGFAILNVSLSHNLLPPAYQQVILAALLISIMIAPILIRYNKNIATFCLPKFKEFGGSASQHEIIEFAKNLHQHIVICGYGRVGQQVSRLLEKIKFPYIAIELDIDLVQRASLAGENVIYGDAGNPGILQASGIEHAKVLVISLSDYRAAIKILSMVRQHYPNLPILVRCHDKNELSQLKKISDGKNTHIIAELFETSLTLSNHLLQIIHLPKEKITEIIEDVRNSDYELLQKVYTGTIAQIEAEVDIEEQEQLNPIVIYEDAYAVNRQLTELNLKEINVEVVSIRRGKEKHLKPYDSLKIEANDIVVLFGSINNLETAERRFLEGY